MGKDERIVLIIGGVALAALLLYHMDKLNNGPVESGTEPMPEFKVVPSGVANYMVYNQPFLFAPPVANILPETSSGILGQSFTQPPPTLPANDWGESNYYS